MKQLLFLSTLFCLLIFNSVTAQNQWDIQFSQSSLNCATNQVCYQLEVQNTAGADWTIADQNYRLFFDGDLMTVATVTSLLPSTFYSTANIDQNIKISGQGQEAASPLDDIDDNLGFLDFSIIQTDKNNPSAATQLVWGTFTPVAEICVDVDAAVLNDGTGTSCLAFYHSRPSTAGSITNQYTVISENNTAGSTTAATGMNYDDLTSADGAEACLGLTCAPPPVAENEWDIQLSQSNLNCSTNQVCYQLEVQNTAGADWTIADQNYRLFFDGDLMTVTSVTSLLPSAFYGTANIDQNIKIAGQGQEAASPLDDIDDNLGFLDFSIIQTDKNNPSAATQLTTGIFTPVAEICVDVVPAAINGSNGTQCLALYHSRPSTAGSITNQYTVISENNTTGSTTAATGMNYDDLTSVDGVEACLSLGCTPTNVPPMLQDGIFLVDEDGIIIIDVISTSSDSDGSIDTSSITIINPPNNGTTTTNTDTGEITFTPDSNFNGNDTLTYSLCDDGTPTMCDTATVFLIINPMNDAPVANDDEATTDENQFIIIDILDNDTDVDGPIDPANIEITNMPSNGTATVNPTNGEITYTPDTDFSGTDTLTYIVCDDLNTAQFCSTATVIITVNNENEAPSNGNEYIFPAPNIGLNNIDLDDNNIDPEGDNLTVNVPIISTQGGVVTNNNNGSIDYTPPSGFTGEDLVIYTVCDPTPSCVTDTLFIQVGGCLTIETGIWLEGAYENGAMHTKLNDLKYLPGQAPSTYLGIETSPGQPYHQAPWNYSGAEGQNMSYQITGTANAGYPSTVVDWVLVSLRTGTDDATTACQRAGLLHSDGAITFLQGFDCCNINLAAAYYIVIEHRNHLLVMSHEAVNITGTTISYDFRTQQSYTNGGIGQKEIAPAVFVMMGANGEQTNTPASDTNIEIDDFIHWQTANGNHSSYYLQDFDLNGDVNVHDKSLWLENKNNSSNVPNL